MDDPVESFIFDLSKQCLKHAEVLQEVVRGYTSHLTEDDFSRWEETFKQLKESESRSYLGEKLQFSKRGLPLHMFDSFSIQNLSKEDVE
jgi:hypothetical protein